MPIAEADQALDLDTIVREEIEKMPPCESTNHDLGLWAHVPGDPAEYLVIAPCGASWNCCAGWVHAHRDYTMTNCGREMVGGCGFRHVSTDYVYLPLDLGNA